MVYWMVFAGWFCWMVLLDGLAGLFCWMVLLDSFAGGRIFDNLQIDNQQIDNRKIDNLTNF